MNPILELILGIIAGFLQVAGALFVLVAAIAMFRVRDAISRINVFSPATGLGLPVLVAGVHLEHILDSGFDLINLLMTLMTIVALVTVASVASNVLSRSAYLSGAPIDPATDPQDLAREPEVDLTR